MAVPSIILAAGASRRLGEPKQLVMFRGETLLARTIRIANEAAALPAFVVLGSQAELIAAAVAPGGANIVHNPQWEDGMSSSLHAGLRAVQAAMDDTEGVLILACDQPRLEAEHLRALMGAFASGGGMVIAASIYEGVRGIPAIFPRALFPQLYAIRGDKGARSLLVEPPCKLVEVDFPDGGIDIDVPPDLKALR